MKPPPSRWRRGSTALLFALMTLPASAVHGQQAAPGEPSPGVVAHAKELHRRGLAVLESGDWERALEYFRKSRALYPSTQNITNEAVCLHRLGRFDEALEVYEVLLTQYAEGLDAEDRAAIGPAMAELRSKVGSIWLSSNVDATVLVDGRERGKLPLHTAIRVLQGKRKIRVVKNGYGAFESDVSVPVGQTVKIDAKLRPLKEVGTLRVEDEAGQAVGVYVDGAKVGVTPWEGLLAPGEHLVWTRLGDQGSSLSAITVVEGQIGLVRTAVADLGPEIRVTVQPRTAAIEIDGIGVGTGHWSGQLPAGDHAITFFEAGYVTQTKRFTGRPGAAAVALDERLDIDEDHPRWPSMFEGNFWLGVSGGWAVTDSLRAGAEQDCPSRCSSDPIAQGILAEARAGYRFSGGLSLELAGGYLWLTKHVERSLQDQYGVGDAYTANYDITDDIYVRGPFVGPGVSYRMPISESIALLGRTTLGIFFSVAHDDVRGTAYTTGDAVPIVLGERTFERQVTLFVMPELGAHAIFDRLDLGLSLGVAVFPFIEGPVLPNQPLGVVPSDDPNLDISDIRAAKNTDALADDRAYGSFRGWVPRLSAAYTF